MDNPTIDIGKMRVAAGLTQAQLAEAAGCTQATIARIEKGANARKALMLQILYVLRHESKENAGIMDALSSRLENKQCAECDAKAGTIKALREIIEAQKAAIEAMKQTIETMKRDQGHPAAPPGGTTAQTAHAGGRKLPA